MGHGPYPSDSKSGRPYLLLDYVDSEKGTMLSDPLKNYWHTDPEGLQNLLRGISRIMISLASKAQPRIGSLRFNNDGSIALANRPLFCANTILESEGAPKIVSATHPTDGSFIDDMLRFRKEAFRAQPNDVNDKEDCHLQMLHMILLRDMKSLFVDRLSQGPFIRQLTDLHASNIFVDSQWNVVALIDLESVCALPPSMLSMPHWLLVDAIDEVIDKIDAFNRLHELFIDILRDEEKHLNHGANSVASAVETAWGDRSHWFYRCFTTVNGIPCCVEDHLYEKLGLRLLPAEEARLAREMSSRWSTDSKGFVTKKLRDKAKYDIDLARHFDKQAGAKDGKVKY